MFRGSIVALVTPMHNGAVDIERLQGLVERHITEGTHALVAAGTTGESGTLSHAEKLRVIEAVIKQAAERISVIAGTGANATKECIELTTEAMELGADAALIMTPAYIKPTQEGLYQHYMQIASAVPIPIILYNVPSRTACDLLPETVGRLAHCSNIIGIKEATGTMERLQLLQKMTEGRIDIFSGDDLTAAEWMLAGVKGVISVTANVAPRCMAKLADCAIDTDKTRCVAIHEQLLPLHRLMFVESNPIPVKWALHCLGLIENEIRSPLTPLTVANQNLLREVLQDLNLLPSIHE
jgi:4-hydroxy-tetrahydrodipicolinate synthase